MKCNECTQKWYSSSALGSLEQWYFETKLENGSEKRIFDFIMCFFFCFLTDKFNVV